MQGRLNYQPGNPWPGADLAAMRGFFEHVDYGIVLLDRDLRSGFINRAFCDIWRLPKVKADNEPTFADLIQHGRDTGAYAVPASQLDRYVCQRIDSIRAGNVPTLDLRLNDGRAIRLLCGQLPKGGRILSYLDVSDLVRRAERLEKQLAQTLRAPLQPADHDDPLRRRPAAIAPWQVRRAEKYIEANWHRPIDAQDLAAATGASERSLFRAFRQARGYSPMEFVKRLRLRQAQRMLKFPEAATTVTTVALACGFGDLGRFSRDYRASFGELPSRALARAKGE